MIPRFSSPRFGVTNLNNLDFTSSNRKSVFSLSGITLKVSQSDDVIVDVVAEEQNPEDNINNDGKDFKTILDLAFEKDPSFADVRIPFIDPLGNNFIECKPHFVVNHNDVSYTIATPHDHTVGLSYMNDETGKWTFLSLDENNSNDIGGEKVIEDIFKIASMQISKAFNDELKLRKTPGTLTIEGDLDKFVSSAWEQRNNDIKELDEPAKWIDRLSSSEEDEDEYFETTMRRILGDEYVEEDDDEELDPEILKLFDNDYDETDDEDIAKFMNDIFFGDDDVVEDDDSEEKSQNAYAERLLSFHCDNKLFSLVRMKQPAVIVGREDPEVDSRRVLLTPQESLLIMPSLEKICREELRSTGLLEA